MGLPRPSAKQIQEMYTRIVVSWAAARSMSDGAAAAGCHYEQNMGITFVKEGPVTWAESPDNTFVTRMLHVIPCKRCRGM